MSKILAFIFVAGTTLFVLGGVVIVSLQIFSIATLDGEFSSFVADSIAPPVFIISAITGLISHFMQYTEKWNTND